MARPVKPFAGAWQADRDESPRERIESNGQNWQAGVRSLQKTNDRLRCACEINTQQISGTRGNRDSSGSLRSRFRSVAKLGTRLDVLK
jgi:hypothetical protein